MNVAAGLNVLMDCSVAFATGLTVSAAAADVLSVASKQWRNDGL